MANRTNHVIVVEAGVSGLACALHLRSTGREVTVLERDSAPGGRLDTMLELDGFRFDTGPARAMTPEALAVPLRAVDEQLRDWIEMLPVDPICRAHYPDGTTIDVHADAGRTVASIAAVCGRGEAAAYLRYLKLARYRVPPRAVLRDERTRRLFDAAALFGFPITENAWYPSGGASTVPRMLAGVAEKHGISIRYRSEVNGWESAGGRVTAARTVDGERIPADAVVIPARRPRRGASHLVLHLGSSARYSKIAHHNLHFGAAWRVARHQVLKRGELMGDPTLLVSAPGATDPGAAGVLQVIVPVPNLRAPVPWATRATRAYAGEVMAVLEARGYMDLGASVRVSYVVSPRDWAGMGMAYGVPCARVRDRGGVHHALENVVVVGIGLESGTLAAQRVIGAL
ncbi:MAG TPA: FAD-dependent oxidoreductase [Candidatus Limnocylindrales bacterium]|nr:FAD-dependent oxidoreductase [Candidatus Limnocylindrales bacterium]